MKKTVRHIARFIRIWLPVAIALLSQSCVSDTPYRLEPEIVNLQASGVTRTEATLTAAVRVHGGADLSHFRFVYGIEDAMDLATEVADSETMTPEVHVSGLKPGHTYSFRCEGWNDSSSALIVSETACLTTDPNERPTVSAPVILSSGPTGLMAAFVIQNDGGTPVLSAGFIIKEIGAADATYHYLPDEELGMESLRAYLGGLRTHSEYTMTPFAENEVGRTLGESLSFTTGEGLVLTEPGVLRLLMGTEGHAYDYLEVSGPLDGDDLHYLRLMLGASSVDGSKAIHSVRRLNLRDSYIVSGGGTYDDSHYTETDVIGAGMFADCPRLEEVLLSSRATAIRRDAFSRSPLLRAIEIPASVCEVLPSSECQELTAISVSAANRYFKSFDGVLFNASANSLIWFPPGKEGSFEMPEDLTTLGENAFHGCRVSHLGLPAGLKELGRGCFSSTGLESIVIPDGVRNIPETLFQDSASLTDVTLGENTEYIGKYVFDGCPLTHLRIKAQNPPVVLDRTFPEDGDFFKRCTLHVPKAAYSIYRNHPLWQKFTNISTE